MGATPRVMYDLIDRLIDSQISNTAMLTSLLVLMRENQIEIKDINGHFTNGFRSELKDHITDEQKIANESVEKLQDFVENLQDAVIDQQKLINERIDDLFGRKEEEIERIKRIDKFISSLRRTSTYIKWIVAVIVAVGTVVGGIATVVESWPWDKSVQKTPVTTPSNP